MGPATATAMVPNLVKAGHRVSVWNRTLAATRALEGVTVLPSIASAFERDAVVTMLSDDTAVRSVIIDSGALAFARKDCVHVMMSTLSLALVEVLQELHRREGIAYVAAPVFGVPAMVAQAQWNILVAGNAEAVATVQPLLDAMGQKTWHLGDDPRHANVAKIAGNLMITLAIEAMGEAMALTESYGLKAVDFLEVVTNTMFASPSYQRYGGNIAHNSHEPGFELTPGLKDVNLALEAAKAKQALLPAAEIVRETMLEAVEQGLGSKDWSALAKVTRGVSSCPDSLTNLDNRVLAALDQSGLPAFLPHSGKLAHQVMSARAHGLERALSGPTIAPPPCVRAHLHAGLACFLGVSLHRLLPSRMYLDRAGRTPPGPPPLRYAQEGEPLLFCTYVLLYPTLSRLSSDLERRRAGLEEAEA